MFSQKCAHVNDRPFNDEYYHKKGIDGERIVAYMWGMSRYSILPKLSFLIALTGASLTLVHAESVLSPLPPVALPESMTSAQMKAWKSDLAAKSAASSAPGTLNSGVPTPLAPQKLGAALQSNYLPPVAGFYTGKPYLAESGSYAFKYRDYNPEMNRWTTVDPSGFPDGANNRVYAAAPTSQLDNNGLELINQTVTTGVSFLGISDNNINVAISYSYNDSPTISSSSTTGYQGILGAGITYTDAVSITDLTSAYSTTTTPNDTITYTFTLNWILYQTLNAGIGGLSGQILGPSVAASGIVSDVLTANE